MRIEQIDKNFVIEERGGVNVKAIRINELTRGLYGVYYNAEKSRFERMPEEVASKVNPGVHRQATNTAGGRLRFSTDSDILEMEMKCGGFTRFSHMPLSGTAGFALCEDDGVTSYHVGTFMPPWEAKDGYSGKLKLRGGKRSYTLYFPLYNDVFDLTLYVSENAQFSVGAEYKDVKPILYYGSSITQGGCASRPDGAYQARICKWNNIDFINLGFSGSAKGEEVIVDYLAGIDCSIFVCDYDHNAPNAEFLDNTHYSLYQRYRQARKDTPILFVTRPDYDYAGDGEKRRKVVLSTYRKAKKAGDNNVYFMDGRKFYGKGDRTVFAVDTCHPTELGFEAMAKHIYKKIVEIDERLK